MPYKVEKSYKMEEKAQILERNYTAKSGDAYQIKWKEPIV